MRKSGLAIRVCLAIALAALAAGGGVARAQVYGSYRVSKLVTITTSPSGSNQATVDLRSLDEMIADLARHAMHYPPHFDSTEDVQRARADVANALKLLGVLASNPQLPPQILLRIARLASLGHNLDVPMTGREASATYLRLLALAPRNGGLNFEYGNFLAGTAQPERAIPYLEKAKSSGIANADYPLALVYAATGNRTLALKNIESYLKRVPGDADAAKIRDAIRSGHINVKKGAP